MRPTLLTIWVILSLAAFQVRADEPLPATPNRSPDEEVIDLENEETFIDMTEALSSKQYVHRAILSNIIKNTSRMEGGKLYLNHNLGFSSVWQRVNGGAKYGSGMTGLALGYVLKQGHGFEFGLEVASINNIFLGYRYFIRPETISLWFFAGGGGGKSINFINFSEGPPETKKYSGASTFGYFNFGIMVPLVDIALKAESKFSFYSLDRITFTQGIGAILFL